ncbi:AzlD domain-containing protein [Pseudogracilibacillus auburnensis]|uniref:Branched-subunit amino acid transport protein n=1 Tax=Pseudogracilibacillus auburnensis TaxID=1494959 RepID=A0A2V3W028_9BACI|nr:AzlD domain-containing protein [Pseudogracilibacillus auburnensis]PXW87412.1 branched-subunit amino acid transport protein [Pseudogracilibacillus auburnensis]
MEINTYILWIIIGTAVVTFIPRVLPFIILSRLDLPEWVLKWLEYVPVAVMAALLAQEVLIYDNELSFSFQNLKLLAIVPTFITAIITRSLIGTVLVGILSMLILQYVFI